MSASHPHGFLSATRRRIRCAVALRLLLALLASGVLFGCTTVGVPTSQQQAFDYGPPMQLRVCVLRTDGVSPERVDKLIAAVNREFEPDGIEVVVPWVRPWKRTSFTHATMVEDVVGRELEAPCDRLIGFVDHADAVAVHGRGAVQEVRHGEGHDHGLSLRSASRRDSPEIAGP